MGRTGGERCEEQLRIPDDGGLVLRNTDELLITGEGFAGQLVGAGPEVSLAAYDRLTGEQKWSADEGIGFFGGPSGAARADDVMIIQQFVDAAPHGVAAVNHVTGRVQWGHGDTFAGFDSDGAVVVGATGAVSGPTAGESAAYEGVGQSMGSPASALAASRSSSLTSQTS